MTMVRDALRIGDEKLVVATIRRSDFPRTIRRLPLRSRLGGRPGGGLEDPFRSIETGLAFFGRELRKPLPKDFREFVGGSITRIGHIVTPRESPYCAVRFPVKCSCWAPVKTGPRRYRIAKSAGSTPRNP